MWSYEDLKGAFYLFKLRPEWAKVFCFDMVFDATELGVPGSGPRWIRAVTLPMCWPSLDLALAERDGDSAALS